MSHILLLRLSGPMQSWGVMSRFSRRDTGKEPSKSGVIGLLCAALGISRDDADIRNPTFRAVTELDLGVRVLREGMMQSDYHTAQNIAKADGGIKDTELSRRFYLAGADFVAALHGNDRALLEKVQDSLLRPKWQLFLGRKAFVPDMPVYFPDGGIREAAGPLEAALRDVALTEAIESIRNRLGGSPFPQVQRLVIEDDVRGSEMRQDVPISFAKRRFTVRRVRTEFLSIQNGGEVNGDIPDQDRA